MVRAKRSRYLSGFPDWAWYFDETQWAGATVLNRWLSWVEAIVKEANADDRSKRYLLDWLRVSRNVRRTAARLEGPEPDDLDRAMTHAGIRLVSLQSQEMLTAFRGNTDGTRALDHEIASKRELASDPIPTKQKEAD